MKKWRVCQLSDAIASDDYDWRAEAGFTALHLATLKNSPASMQVLLGAGASLEAGILDAGNTPMLARGSTALHIAAARGSFACCTVLLDFQLAHPGALLALFSSPFAL